MTSSWTVLPLTVSSCTILAFLFAVGANSGANSIATAVGSNALRPSAAVALGFVSQFAGAVLASHNRNDTRSGHSGVVTPLHPKADRLGALAAFSAVFSVAGVIATATAVGVPLSPSLALCGAVLGISFTVGQLDMHVSWYIIIRAASASWLLSPFMGSIFAILIRYLLNCASSNYACYRFLLPLLSSTTVFSILNVLMSAIPTFVDRILPQYWMVYIIEGMVVVGVFTVTMAFMKRNPGASVVALPVYNIAEDEDMFDHSCRSSKTTEVCPDEKFLVMDVPLLTGDAFDAEGVLLEPTSSAWTSSFVMDEHAPIFRLLLALTAAGVACADGAASIEIGMPLIIQILNFNDSEGHKDVNNDVFIRVGGNHHLMLIVTGAFTVALGLAMASHRVIATVGMGIARHKMSFARAYAAQISALLAIVTAKSLSLPLDNSYCVITAVAISNVVYIPASERLRDNLAFPALCRIAWVAFFAPFLCSMSASLIYKVLITWLQK